MPAARVVASSTLAICFGLASRDYTFDGSAFCAMYFFKKFRVETENLHLGCKIVATSPLALI